jgi:hypothetical protein
MSHHITHRWLFLGSFIHSKNLEELEFLHDTAICVDEKGVIVAIEPGCEQTKAEESLLPKLGWTKGEVTIKVAKPGQFFFPGFIGSSFPPLFRPNPNNFIRYPHPCLPIPKCRYLWEDHAFGLAKYLHLSHGSLTLQPHQSQNCILKMYPTDALSRNHYRVLLCHH